MYKIAYLASDVIAVDLLQTLLQIGNLQVVGSKPDRAAKRGLKLTPTPIKQKALAEGLTVFTEPPTYQLLQQYQVDLVLVFAYGNFIDQQIFENIPTINIHPSLLPVYRGPSPIQTALLNGDSQTGVSLFFINKQMDAGDLLLQEKIIIDPNDNYQSLSEKVIAVSSQLVKQLLSLSLDQIFALRKPQDEKLVSFCRLIQKEDQRITVNESPQQIHNKVRAIGGFIEKSGKRIKIIETKISQEGLTILKVQLPGKNVISYRDFLNANPALAIGEIIK